MNTTIDRMLLVQLTNLINENLEGIGLPVPLLFDAQDDAKEQLWLTPQSGTVVTKRYISGNYEGQLPFAVRYQLPKTAIAGEYAKLDVPLWRLAEWFEKNKVQLDGARIDAVEMTGLPGSFRRYENGTAVNQAIYRLTYYKEV